MPHGEPQFNKRPQGKLKQRLLFRGPGGSTQLALRGHVGRSRHDEKRETGFYEGLWVERFGVPRLGQIGQFEPREEGFGKIHGRT